MGKTREVERGMEGGHGGRGRGKVKSEGEQEAGKGESGGKREII